MSDTQKAKRAKRSPSPADREAALAAFGAWAGNVDIDRLKEGLKESRRLTALP